MPVMLGKGGIVALSLPMNRQEFGVPRAGPILPQDAIKEA
jgi:hypothetical protein